MTPEEFFSQHPRLYGLALSGPALTCGYALTKMRGAPDRRQQCRYAALAALTAVQFVGLLRWRPTRPPASTSGSRRTVADRGTRRRVGRAGPASWVVEVTGSGVCRSKAQASTIGRTAAEAAATSADRRPR